MKTISTQTLYHRLQTDRSLLLLEALPERYYVQKHLPGARLFPHDEVDRRAAAVIPGQGSPVVVYCASRSCQNSRIAAQRLIQLGYTDVTVYEGGKQEWEQGGLPFEIDSVAETTAA